MYRLNARRATDLRRQSSMVRRTLLALAVNPCARARRVQPQLAVFASDAATCPCGGRLKLVQLVLDPTRLAIAASRARVQNARANGSRHRLVARTLVQR